MATNYVQAGRILEFTAPTGGVVSGTPVKIGQLLVMPLVTAAQTLPFNGQVDGVWTITKVGSQAWTEGALVYWDDGNSYFTTTASGNLLAGVAVDPVGSGAGETSGVVRLNGIASSDIP